MQHHGSRAMNEVTRSQCMHLRTPCYCEENVWHILRHCHNLGFKSCNLFAVFISNSRRCIPFYRQVASSSNASTTSNTSQTPLLWDYHVIAVVNLQSFEAVNTTLVYDIDSTLPFPCSLHEYVSNSLDLPSARLSATRHPSSLALYQFRVVPYDQLMAKFSSDRRHMICGFTVEEGLRVPLYASPPPPRRCIEAKQSDNRNTLPMFLVVNGLASDDALCSGGEMTMAENELPGHLVCSVEALLEYFRDRRAPGC